MNKHDHIPSDIIKEFRDSLVDNSGIATLEFHRKYPDFCSKSMDYFEKMGKFAENAATKDDLKQIVDKIKYHEEKINDHEDRLLDYEGLKADMKNVIQMGADFVRWREKVYKLCTAGFVLMALKAMGAPEWFVKVIVAAGAM